MCITVWKIRVSEKLVRLGISKNGSESKQGLTKYQYLIMEKMELNTVIKGVIRVVGKNMWNTNIILYCSQEEQQFIIMSYFSQIHMLKF